MHYLNRSFEVEIKPSESHHLTHGRSLNSWRNSKKDPHAKATATWSLFFSYKGTNPSTNLNVRIKETMACLHSIYFVLAMLYKHLFLAMTGHQASIGTLPLAMWRKEFLQELPIMPAIWLNSLFTNNDIISLPTIQKR